MELEIYPGHVLDLLGSRDVIGHVTIWLAMCGFLLVVNYSHTSILHGYGNTQDNSLTTAVISMKFCVNMFLDNRTKPREFQDSTSQVKVKWPYFRILYHCNIGQKSLLAR